MSYLVNCTFDLKNATSRDYQDAYQALDGIGLKKTIVADGGSKVVAPTTMTIGTFTGKDAGSVRDDISNSVAAAFRALNLTSEIFVIVGGDWAWGGRTT